VTDAEDNTTEQVPAAGLDVQLAAELIERAKEQGVSLVGQDGLLAGITKTVLQAALDAEMSEHLGYEKGERPAQPGGNHRNGHSPKTVLTEVGSVPLRVPRDRAGQFEPKIVPKHARRIEGFDEAIVSLYAKGLTTGEIRSHLTEIYDVVVSRDLISRVTDRVAEELAEWQSRPLDGVYPVVMIDAIYGKIRDGQVTNRPIYVALGINCHGARDVLGLWVGTGGEGAKHWMGVLAELKNRGINDVCIVCCDGLKGLPEAINEIWPQATVQQCVVHLALEPDHQASARDLHRPDRRCRRGPLRRLRRRLGRQVSGDQPAVANQLGAIHSAPGVPAGDPQDHLTTNAIESLNARFRQATRRRGHFPTDQAALKVLYLVIPNPHKNRANVTGQTPGWKTALNALSLYYGDRITLN
jgi:transposase-like protein